jgi:HSP20 family protein
MLSDFTRSFEPLLSLQQALDQAMGRDFFGLSTTDRGTFPPVSVFKAEDEFLVTAELPGIRKESLSIEVKNDLLRLSGERKPDYDPKEVSVHRNERSFGRFDRTVRLPFAVNAEAVRAEYQDGVLSVRLPLSESVKPKKITIA